MLHVLVGADCNNNCLFCMESDRRRRAARLRSQSPSDIRAMLEGYRGADEVLFTSGEPTLAPELLAYVRWAKERGFRTIALITNGRRLAYRGYVAQLVEAGVNRVTISIHGHTARLHDSLTRCRGSFAQSIAGLANLSRLRRGRRLQLHSSTVVTQRSLPHLESIFRLLAHQGVDVIVLNAMMARGRGAVHAARLLPSYRAVVDAVGRLCGRLEPRQLGRLRVEDLPACFAEQIPAVIRGETEEYDQYEESGSTGLTEVGVLNSASCRGAVAGAAGSGARQPGAGTGCHVSEVLPPANLLAAVRDRVSGVALRGEDCYYLTQRSFKDRLTRLHGPPCEVCLARERCPGVWQGYVSAYGWDEFTPIRMP